VEGATDTGTTGSGRGESGDPTGLSGEVSVAPPPPQALNSPVIDNTLAKSKPIKFECFMGDFSGIPIFRTTLPEIYRIIFEKSLMLIITNSIISEASTQVFSFCIQRISAKKNINGTLSEPPCLSRNVS
jgi:hypothetical protein